MDRKHTYRTWDTAARVAARLAEPGRVYWCAVAGGYHITRQDLAENARRVAARATQEEAVAVTPHTHTPAVDIPADHNGQRPCICGRHKANRVHDPDAVDLVAAEQAAHRARIGDDE